MRIHCLQHVPFEGPASIENGGQHAGHDLSTSRLYLSDPFPSPEKIDWLVIMGGPMSIHDESAFPWLVEEKRYVEQVLRAGKKILGICLGAQLIASVLGARVYPGADKEIGWFPVRKTAQSNEKALTEWLPDEVDVFHWHGETFDLPSGAVHLASSAAYQNQAFLYGRRVIALQFHLESTPESVELLLTHSADDLTAGPHVQTFRKILGRQEQYAAINRVMESLLSTLAAGPNADGQ